MRHHVYLSFVSVVIIFQVRHPATTSDSLATVSNSEVPVGLQGSTATATRKFLEQRVHTFETIYYESLQCSKQEVQFPARQAPSYPNYVW